MTDNDLTTRVVQAFNLATGRELSMREAELFARILEAVRAQLICPDEEPLPPSAWRKGDTVKCRVSPNLQLWTPGLCYQVLGVAAETLRLSHNAVMPEWLVLDLAGKQFEWVGRS